jgi:8-oxo-dGTP diphosphatase
VNNALIHVAAAAVVNDSGDVLVSQRKQGTHLGGYWEFPGGKLEPGESFDAALHRELKEELDIVPLSSRPLIRTRYDYPEKSVLLDVWKIEAYTGQVKGVEGQRIKWQAIETLDQRDFPPADIPIINALLLPERYLITGEFNGTDDFASRLTAALGKGIELVQLRLTHDWLQDHTRAHAAEIMALCGRLCKQFGASLMLNIAEPTMITAADGLHLNSRRLLQTRARPDYHLVSASCHNREQLEHAQSVGVDFAVLSPVKKTTSHADARPLGWKAFQQLVDNINIPVYALGGLTADNIEQAWHCGAQGVAAISAFWK